MKRQLENWLESYVEFSRDGFVPPEFHYWSGLQTIAAATERKTSLPWGGMFAFYPNLYTMLVAPPGVGKSSAINVSLKFLYAIEERGAKLNIISDKITEAQFVEEMSVSRSYDLKGKDGQVTTVRHCSGFFSASEASNTLKNAHGDLTDMLTNLYDNPPVFKKSTKKDGTRTLFNPCVNLTAGCTFNYFHEIFKGSNLEGGFASRFVYVVCEEVPERKLSWQNRENKVRRDPDLKKKLITDLLQIHSLAGEFRAEPGFIKQWEEWANDNDAALAKEKNREIKALLARKDTQLKKIAMLHSLAEGNDLMLKEQHFVHALEDMDAVTKDLPKLLAEVKTQDFDGRPTRQNIFNHAAPLLSSGTTVTALCKELGHRFSKNEIEAAVNDMKRSGRIKASEGGKLFLSF